MKRLLAAAVLALGLAGVAHAAIDTYEFANDAERERFRDLTKELRCPKCQNQDIADSNAPIAADLRKEIFRMLGEGKDNQQIIDFMVDRYGDFVRYKPALTGKTALLWFGPAALLLTGVVVMAVIVRRRRVAPRVLQLRASRARRRERMEMTGRWGIENGATAGRLHRLPYVVSRVTKDSVHVHVTSDCSLLGVVASSRHSDRRRTRPLSRRLGAMHGRPLAHSDGARARQEATTVGWSAAPRW